MSAAARYSEQFSPLSATLAGHHLPWLNQLRQAAEARFTATGFPSVRDEEWRYTSLATLEKKLFQPGSRDAATPAVSDAISRARLADAWSLVFVDGRYAAEFSSVSDLPHGVQVLALAEALQSCPDNVATALTEASRRERHGMVDFARAYFSDGAFIDVPSGVVLPKPIQVIHLATRADGLSALQHLIEIAPQAEAKVIETYIGTSAVNGLTVAISDINVGANASLEHCKLQLESEQAHHFGGVYATIGRSGRLHQHHAALGGLLSRTDLHCDLGHAAECDLDGVFLSSGRRHVDTHTLLRHTAPHGRSRETYRGIATQRSRGVFSGRIIVEPNAQKTDAELSNRNLLLSDDAEIDSKPQLEILADDVKCAHGVTVGQLDPQSVFYLQSRGMSDAAARSMLTFAFANEIAERLPFAELRAQVRDALLAALPQSDLRGDWL